MWTRGNDAGPWANTLGDSHPTSLNGWVSPRDFLSTVQGEAHLAVFMMMERDEGQKLLHEFMPFSPPSSEILLLSRRQAGSLAGSLCSIVVKPTSR